MLALSTGAASAVSAGGYEPTQQDCPWNSSAQDAGTGQQNPGAPDASVAHCHNTAVNVESGGTTNGNPDASNSRYVEWGNDQAPNNTPRQTESYHSFGAVYYLGDPGSERAAHSGCLAANTDGTGGGTGTGCGTNNRGAGFAENYDLYTLYCPVADPVLNRTGGSTDPAGTVAAANTSNGLVYAPALYACQQAPPQLATPTVTHGTVTTGIQKALSQGLLVYFGMDDNTDNGEHDGFTGLEGPCHDQYPNKHSGTQNFTCHSAGAINGPSDGGAIIAVVDPTGALGLRAPSQTQPENVANLSGGFCADSYCAEWTTQRQTVFYGCYSPADNQVGNWTASGTDGATNSGSNALDPSTGRAYDQCAPGTAPSSNVYENDAPTQQSAWPDDCGSDSIGPQDPGPNGNGTYGGGEANCVYGTPDQGRQTTPEQMNAEPGVQIYHDPDGQGAGANEGSGINLPSAYAGTCGIYLNNGGGSHNYDQYNQSQFNDSLARTPLASSGSGGYVVDGNKVPGSQCGEG